MARKFHPLLKDAIELHVHSSPSVFPRRQTDWELVADVWQAGMAGVVIKAHEGQTYDRAALIREQYPNLHVYGGLVCNVYSGGLSPDAVDMAIRCGAKVVWMPTISAKQHAAYFRQHRQERFFNSEKHLDMTAPSLTIFNDRGVLRDEVYEMLSLIAEADIVLATGHLSPKEVDVLSEEAFQIGVKKVLVQHADLGIAKIPLDLQETLANRGCMIEKCYLACGPDFNDLSIEEMAASIQRLGAASCVLVTDYGQAHNIPPVEGLSEFIECLLKQRVSEEQITQMVQVNPKQLLNIKRRDGSCREIGKKQ
ncbi:DUF6282 family protein [Texcoconibacillus texcoconensis]|uniref:Cytosolic protein n=1 Tax=Texcoconibacillus texcoconensis TaxID=1095777 RepID=A0A840QLX4_9BACI|nr:DUF6282 family protein [Texcoconibacillus texcoconensis]MBB5172375.1 hypothetical protein [Texcoconibacillus texcoconensis]